MPVSTASLLPPIVSDCCHPHVQEHLLYKEPAGGAGWRRLADLLEPEVSRAWSWTPASEAAVAAIIESAVKGVGHAMPAWKPVNDAIDLRFRDRSAGLSLVLRDTPAAAARMAIVPPIETATAADGSQLLLAPLSSIVRNRTDTHTYYEIRRPGEYGYRRGVQLEWPVPVFDSLLLCFLYANGLASVCPPEDAPSLSCVPATARPWLPPPYAEGAVPYDRSREATIDASEVLRDAGSVDEGVSFLSQDSGVARFLRVSSRTNAAGRHRFLLASEYDEHYPMPDASAAPAPALWPTATVFTRWGVLWVAGGVLEQGVTVDYCGLANSTPAPGIFDVCLLTGRAAGYRVLSHELLVLLGLLPHEGRVAPLALDVLPQPLVADDGMALDGAGEASAAAVSAAAVSAAAASAAVASTDALFSPGCASAFSAFSGSARPTLLQQQQPLASWIPAEPLWGGMYLPPDWFTEIGLVASLAALPRNWAVRLRAQLAAENPDPISFAIREQSTIVVLAAPRHGAKIREWTLVPVVHFVLHDGSLDPLLVEALCELPAVAGKPLHDEFAPGPHVPYFIHATTQIPRTDLPDGAQAVVMPRLPESAAVASAASSAAAVAIVPAVMTMEEDHSPHAPAAVAPAVTSATAAPTTAANTAPTTAAPTTAANRAPTTAATVPDHVPVRIVRGVAQGFQRLTDVIVIDDDDDM